MLRGKLALVLAMTLLASGAAMAQETTQPTTPATEPPAVTEEGECVLPKVPGRLMITMPTEPTLPACAAKNNCSKAVADGYNASVSAYNKSLARVNEATGDYVDALNEFARKAGRYAACELDRVNSIVTK